MTFKDLQKFVESYSTEQKQKQTSPLFARLKDSPFWIWALEQHKERSKEQHKERSKARAGDCCFNHIIGLPSKNGLEKPLFDYERLLYDAIMTFGFMNKKTAITTDNEHHRYYGNTRKKIETISKSSPDIIRYPFKEKHLWVKKATGLGVTEFFLRLMAWLCLRNDDCKGSQMVIVTGPNQDLAIKLIKRMKALFESHSIYFDSKETVLELNGCSIEAYPSFKIDSFRSLANPKFILIDEADFLPTFQQEDVRHVAERYIAKSDPYIVMVSTPNAPNGLFEKIEKEPAESCIYKKLFLDYTYGLDKIYTKEEIEKAKLSPSFEREYNLKYLGLIGNVFSIQSIENCTKVEYNPNNIVKEAKKSIGIDPSYGSSKFGIVATQLVDGKIQVIHAEEYPRPNFTDMIDFVYQMKRQYGNVNAIYVDAANPEFWQGLKKELGENYSQEYIKERVQHARQFSLYIEDSIDGIVIPVPFSVEGSSMLSHCKWLLEETEKEDGSPLIAIHPSFDKLLTALRTAVATEYKLDKQQTSFPDILDAFRLSLQFYRRTK